MLGVGVVVLKITHQRGFTIVELLIVIVVIGILAAITIVAYNNIQYRARDAQRRVNVSDIAKAIQAYNTLHGNTIGAGSGCGRQGDGYGWFNYNGSNNYDNTDTTYTKSVLECLMADRLLGSKVTDPSGITAYGVANTTNKYAYMKYDCVENGTAVTYILARLEDPSTPVIDTTNICATVAAPINGYKMNYFIRIQT